MVGFAFACRRLREQYSFLPGEGIGFAARLLERLERGRVLLDGAVDALL